MCSGLPKQVNSPCRSSSVHHSSQQAELSASNQFEPLARTLRLSNAFARSTSLSHMAHTLLFIIWVIPVCWCAFSDGCLCIAVLGHGYESQACWVSRESRWGSSVGVCSRWHLLWQWFISWWRRIGFYQRGLARNGRVGQGGWSTSLCHLFTKDISSYYTTCLLSSFVSSFVILMSTYKHLASSELKACLQSLLVYDIVSHDSHHLCLCSDRRLVALMPSQSLTAQKVHRTAVHSNVHHWLWSWRGLLLARGHLHRFPCDNLAKTLIPSSRLANWTFPPAPLPWQLQHFHWSFRSFWSSNMTTHPNSLDQVLNTTGPNAQY